MVNKLLITLLIVSFVLTTFGSGLAQEPPSHELLSDIQREEVQRYFGYDDALIGYLTLPIDVSLNTNERGYFNDIGFILLIFLPIFALWYLRDKYLKSTYIILPILILVQLIYVSNSFMLTKQNIKVPQGSIYEHIQQESSFANIILGQLYVISNNIGKPINQMLDNITGQSDYISYPILLILLLSLLFLVQKIKLTTSKKIIISSTLIFSFFWLVLSAGIIWYGYFGVFMLLGIVCYRADKTKFKSLQKLFYFICALWICLSFTSRISNVRDMNITEHTGKTILNPYFISRTIGQTNDIAMLNKIHPNLVAIQNAINAENESLVYMVGTTLSFFIENNHLRVYKDAQLGFFNIMDRWLYDNGTEMMQGLKARGFKFLVIDLNTHTLDRTHLNAP